VLAFLLATVVASPSPQPTTLKTIITVHSSQFCTALGKSVRPVLAGLILNDRLIERGRTTFADAGYRATHGAIDSPSVAQVIGPPATSQSEGDSTMVEMHQRQLAKSLEDGVETIEALLADKKRFAGITATDETAKLSAIDLQLKAIAAKQRTAVDLISGQAENSELVALYNRDPSWGGADATNGVSPLEAMKAGHGGEGDAIYNVWQAATISQRPFYDPYEIFTKALVNDQTSISEVEDAASKSIVEAAAGCN